MFASAKRKRTLQTKTFILSLLSIVAICFLGIVLFVLYEKETRNLVLQRDKELARITAHRLSESLNQYFKNLQLTAARINTSTDEPAFIETQLEELKKYYLLFDAGIAIYGKDGAVLFSYPHYIARQKEPFPDRETFARVKATLRPAISNIVEDSRTGDKILLLTVPVIDKNSNLEGVLAGRAMLKYSILETEFAKVLEIKSGHTGYAYLVDGYGSVVHHRENSLVGNSLADHFPVKMVMRKSNGATYSKDLSGSNIICGFAQVPGTNWGVVTQENWDVIVGPMRKYGLWFLKTICVLILFILFCVFWALNRVLNPVKTLTLGAQQIAKGMFDCRIEIKTDDEIQELAEQFNKMALELKNSHTKQELQLEVLRKSHSLLHSVIESPANIIIFSLDTGYRYTAFNNNHRNEIKTKYNIFIENTMCMLDSIDDDYLEHAKIVFDRVLHGEQLTLIRESVSQGTRVYYEMFFNPIFTTDGSIIGLTVFAIGITERKNAEFELLNYQEKLRSLSNELLLAEERERRQISLELHERIGHALANASMKLSVLDGKALAPGYKKIIEETNSLISQIIQDTRTLTFEISPPILYDFGLEAGVDWLVEQTREQHGVEIEFQRNLQFGHRCMDSGFRVLIFRAIRELLFNTIKHAKARTVTVSMVRDADDLIVSVADDGVGFDTSAVNLNVTRSLGFGLFSIKERLGNLGGYLEIESRVGSGTQVTLTSPIKWQDDIPDSPWPSVS
ncbi:cache domain-containing protein [Desulforhopalus singaporensis]|uniref:Oxygen sensor histidine kinase NreB n=1 Tax=Desulforhopalus singaporensis TaxID=91360 RepID=A0A1H0SJA3_9BACT|nr:cache domain-containing protein [Desulforhopalus singaporensis]SDP41226.1 Cache domain-containing protein [Desulforhopalus singaporensis]